MRPRGKRAFAMVARTALGFSRAQSGAQAIEFAFVAPVFLLVMFGGFDGATAMWIKSSLERAAVDASRCAAVTPTLCTNVPSYAASLVTGFTVSASNFTYTQNADCGVSGYAKGHSVIGTYTMRGATGTLLLPSFSGVTLTASACHF